MVKKSWLDNVALAVSPEWGEKRLRSKLRTKFLAQSGYITPRSSKKSMKGTIATPLSPDGDTLPKLSGSRALSRDLFMTSPLAVSTLRRKTINVIGPELKLQSRVDREFLGLDSEEADRWEATFEREFDMWADSYSADFDGLLMFGEMQAQLFFNMLLNGDVFFMLPWRPTTESPYETSVKLIDSDLVRNPETVPDMHGSNIRGGVEKNKQGQISAYWVANYYPSEWDGSKSQTVKRVPIFAPDGKRQIWHFMCGERIGQVRGMPIFAPVIDALKQITRITDAEMMNILVSAFFSVFIKDMSGFGNLMQEGFTPSEVVTGGGGDGPNAVQEAKSSGDEFDLEMGYGNIHYLDDKKDITIADPKKADDSFEKFFDAIARQVSAAANMPIEMVHMHFQTSYTAAKAASNEAWKGFMVDRRKLTKGFCSIVSEEVLRECVLKGRIQAPGYFEDLVIARAWARAAWIGAGQGELNPLDESRAAVIKVNNKLSTREEEYMKTHGDRWDGAMRRYARELDLMDDLDIPDSPEPTEIVGPDGQSDPEPAPGGEE